MSAVSVNVYAYSVNYLTGQLLRGLQQVIRELGLDPRRFADDWPSSERAISTWLQSRDLYKIELEIYDPARPSNAILAPEFDVVYGDDGDDDGSFWADTQAMFYEILKSGALPSQCTYSLLCYTHPGRPDVSGWGPGDSRSRDGMSRYVGGRVIGAPGLAANSAFWARP